MADDAKQVRRVTIALLICMVAYAFANSLLSVLLNDVIDAFSIAGAKQGLMTGREGRAGERGLELQDERDLQEYHDSAPRNGR